MIAVPPGSSGIRHRGRRRLSWVQPKFPEPPRRPSTPTTPLFRDGHRSEDGESPISASLYDRDFYAWANEQAALLRAGRLAAADIEHIAEEIESMGKTEKRELVNGLAVLLLHLLKWRYQPERCCASWEATVIVQRHDLADHLADNPSLKAQLPAAISRAYSNAAPLAVGETNLPKATFPALCPWSFEQIMDEEFWPDA
ncbi:MAG: DUF29 domain-containing protein [Rhodospirillaceae bacterium]